MDTIDTHLLGHIFVSERNIDKVNAFDKYLLNLTISKILKFDISTIASNLRIYRKFYASCQSLSNASFFQDILWNKEHCTVLQ